VQVVIALAGRTGGAMRVPIPALTGLRFVAAFCVVLSHAIPKIVPFASPPKVVVLLSTLSAAGMSLFFVLSGFVIYYNYSETISRPTGLYNFLVARFARLYPLYFVGVSYDLFTGVSDAKLSASKIALPYYATLSQSWVYRPIGDNALIYQFGLISQVAWSISTEWFFYLVFPLACVAISGLSTVRGRLWAAATLITVALAILVFLTANAAAISIYGLEAFGPVGASLQDGVYRWLMYFSPYVRLFEFLLGCLCASIFVRLEIRPSPAEERRGVWLTAGAVLAVAALHWLMFGVESNAPWHRVLQGLHMNFGFAPFLAVLIFCCARYRNAIVRLLAAPAVVLCGEASYSLYLLHLVVIHAFGYEASGISSLRGALIATVQLGVVIATSVGLSLVTWSVIEVPARRWIRRIMTVSAPIAAAEIKAAA
jgi:peptidoglycan/LPS O-acetylase OafA/YrhL